MLWLKGQLIFLKTMSKKRLNPLEFEPLSVQSWAGLPYNIKNHSKWRRIEKDLQKCLVIG
jgi:hypothetical protein